MEGILNEQAFTCHKTDKTKQCAGHMIIKGAGNKFVLIITQLRSD